MTPSAARSSARRQMTAHGESVTLRRLVPAAPSIDKSVRARVTGYRPEELASGVQQGDRRVLLLAEDVEASGFPVPIKSGGSDRLVIRGRVMMIADVDDSTGRIGATLITYIVRATG